MPPPLSTLSLHDALPIYREQAWDEDQRGPEIRLLEDRQQRHTGEHERPEHPAERTVVAAEAQVARDHQHEGDLHQLGRLKAHRSEEHTSELQSRRDLVCRRRSPLFPYTTLFRSIVNRHGTKINAVPRSGCLRIASSGTPASTNGPSIPPSVR